MDVQLSRLLEIGFTKAGHWKLAGDDIDFHLDSFGGSKNVLYA
jgi:hypothetical protein